MGEREITWTVPLPSNLPIAPAGDTLDDQLRLFYVAITRARRLLYLTSYRFDHKGKESARLGFVAPDETTPTYFNPELIELEVMNMTPESLCHRHGTRDTLGCSWPMKALLRPILKEYKLSVTHLQNFLNVADAGPRAFLNVTY